jgi:hypothetical protein
MKDFRVSPANPSTAPSWSADEDANRLMDDVFSDIDALLSGKQPSAKIQTAPQGDYNSIQSLVVPPADFDGSPLEEETIKTPVVIKRGWGYYSERLLLIGSSATLVAVALWMAVNDRLMPQFLSSESTSAVEVGADAEVVAEPIFANYVQRALDNIDRQPTSLPMPVAGQPQAGIPLAPEQNPAVNGQSPQVIERIYIPVYPPDAVVGTQPPAIAPSPQPISPAQPQPTQPQSVMPNLIMPPPPLATVPTLPAPPAVAKDVYTLSGVLDSGDRSAALFNVNGVTQRYRVGEMIGGSNWKLISLRANQVLIGQGGQTKTLYAGESFSVDQ